jgi:hypothetical protein
MDPEEARRIIRTYREQREERITMVLAVIATFFFLGPLGGEIAISFLEVMRGWWR